MLSGAAAPLAAYDQIPMSFEVNQGQTDAQVQYLAHGAGYTLFLTPEEAVLSLQSATAGAAQQSPGAALRMQLVGADAAPQLVGQDQIPSTSNYITGNNPSQWVTDVPNFARVQEPGVYPGVNLVYYGNQQQLEYDFTVAPGTDPGVIRLAFSGAESMALDAQGDLVLHTAAGDVVEHAPVLYQEIAGARQAVSGHYVLEQDGQVGFAVGTYDPSQPLVIDPTLVYSTYLGGDGNDQGNAIAVDQDGNVYISGSTTSDNFPTTAGSISGTLGSQNVFVSKLNAAGTALVYSTYLGGEGTSQANGIAVDSAGDAYITGSTTSNEFPTTAGAFQTEPGDSGNYAFVAKLNPNGSALVYSTYLDGSGNAQGNGIAVDSAGNAYVTGSTGSTDGQGFPTTAGAFEADTDGNGAAFVAKLNANGSALVYSTCLGFDGDSGNGIAVDATGDAFVTGTASSTDFPTTVGAFQTVQSDYESDAFVTKLNATGSALVYSTYLGGIGEDYGTGIAVDSAGNAYITGSTTSTSFPTTAGAFLTGTYGGAFLTKLNANGTALIYSTYLGGNGFDHGTGIAVDSAGDAWITGYTTSTNFPTTADAVQSVIFEDIDAFVSELNADGTALKYSTYLGGTIADEGVIDAGQAIAVDSAGNIYVTGLAFPGNFPIKNALQSTLGGSSNAFIAKFAPGQVQVTPSADTTTLRSSPSSSTIGQMVTFTATVTPDAGSTGTPTGTVTFEEGTTVLGTAPLGADGTASFSLATLAVGCAHHHRRLQRRCQLRRRQRDHARGGQSGRHDHEPRRIAQHLDRRPDGHLHGHRDIRGRVDRHADGQRDVQGRNDRARDRPPRRRRRHLRHLGSGRGLAHHHRRLQRRYRLRQRHRRHHRDGQRSGHQHGSPAHQRQALRNPRHADDRGAHIRPAARSQLRRRRPELRHHRPERPSDPDQPGRAQPDPPHGHAASRAADQHPPPLPVDRQRCGAGSGEQHERPAPRQQGCG